MAPVRFAFGVIMTPTAGQITFKAISRRILATREYITMFPAD